MKFIIITRYGSDTVEAEDFYDALNQAYDNHTGYGDIEAIVRVPNDD